MNKYEKKIFEITKKNKSIHELLRRPKRGIQFHIMDTLADFMLSVKDSFDTKGVYYLVMDETKAELFHITKELDYTKTDITHVIANATKQNKFEYDGYNYKLLKKVR